MKLLILLILFSCSSSYKNLKVDDKCLAHPVLSKSFLSPSPDHPGYLVHRNRCKNVRLYKLNKTFQRTGYKLNFTCVVGDKLYSFCKDRLGLCRLFRDKKLWWGLGGSWFGWEKDFINADYISWESYDFLVDAGTLCKQGI